jgi:hypothetical protein
MNRKGSSSNILFVDRATAKTTHLAGAHVRFGEVHSKEGFPQGTKFTAPLILANLSDTPTKAQIYVDYTIATVARRMSLGEVSLAPGALKQLELAKEMAKRGVLLPVEDAGVDIEYTGKAGAVIGRLTSLDQSGDFVFDVPVKDPLGEMMRGSGSYAWRLDNGYSTIVHIKNTVNKKVYALVQVRYEGGTYNLERLPLAPYQTIAVDIRELRDRQQSDIRDSVMPVGVESGQVVWYEEEVGSLIGRAEVANIPAGIASSFSCGDTCICPPSFHSTYVTASNTAGAVGGSTTMAVYETRRNCTTTFGPYNRTSDSAWTSTNGSVATAASGGSVSHVGLGSCSINAEFTALVYIPDCQTMNVTPKPGIGLSVIEVIVNEVGFKEDHQVIRWSSGAVVDNPDGQEPTWKRTGNPNHPVAYTKGAMPKMFATFGITPTLSGGATVKIRVKNGTTVIVQTQPISIGGAQTVVSPFIVTQALENTVKTTEAIFTWEITYNGGTTWTSLGLSGPHTMHWTYATPLSPPFHSFEEPPDPGSDSPELYDRALEKACGYSNGASSVATILTNINQGIDNEIYYNPGFHVGGHPLNAYTGITPQCLCGNMTALFRGLIRSIGIDGQVLYYFGGFNATTITRFTVGSQGACGNFCPTLRIIRGMKDGAPTDPHFIYHAVVSSNGLLYDPSYGISYPTLSIAETAFLGSPQQVPVQITTAFPLNTTHSGWTCLH